MIDHCHWRSEFANLLLNHDSIWVSFEVTPLKQTGVCEAHADIYLSWKYHGTLKVVIFKLYYIIYITYIFFYYIYKYIHYIYTLEDDVLLGNSLNRITTPSVSEFHVAFFNVAQQIDVHFVGWLNKWVALNPKNHHLLY